MSWNWDAKTITDLITAVAAVFAAIGAWWSRGIAKDIRDRIIAQNVQTTAEQSQSPTQTVNVNVSTDGQGATTPAFQQTKQEQTEPENPNDQQPGKKPTP
jgi:hypothetical protein